jgi:hypothetical protein
MRTSPSTAPHGPDQDTYLVLDDFGQTGQAWRETNVNAADRETVIRNCWPASTATRFGSWRSTLPKAGRVT